MTHGLYFPTDSETGATELCLAGTRAPFYDRAGYQAKLDAVAGRAHGKYSVVRLSWAPEVVDFDFGEESFRYAVATNESGQDVCPAIWMLEQRYEPDEYADSWEAARSVYDPRDGRMLDRGEFPREGWYDAIWACATHDQFCCGQAKEEERRCWGYYKEPSELELKRLRWSWAKAQQDKLVNPFQKLTPAQMEQAAKEALERVQAKRESQRSDVILRIDDNFRTHGHRVRCGENAKHLRHGRYTFFDGFKETPSGLYVPE
jgi:hypothetical protein